MIDSSYKHIFKPYLIQNVRLLTIPITYCVQVLLLLVSSSVIIFSCLLFSYCECYLESHLLIILFFFSYDMLVARFDFSWGDPEYHQETLENLKAAIKSTNKLCAVNTPPYFVFFLFVFVSTVMWDLFSGIETF